MRTLTFCLAMLLSASSAMAELKVEVTQFSGVILTKSVRTESLTDKVAVFCVDREVGEKTGAFLKFTTTEKWVAPYSDNPAITLAGSTVTPGTWMMFAAPGVYRILAIEFNPESGPKFNNVDVTIGTPPPIGPPIVIPPGNFAAVTLTSKMNADRLNDPATRAQLKAAYTAARTAMGGKQHDECKIIVTAARFAVLNARQGASRMVDWESWKFACEKEVLKVVPQGDAVKYSQAIDAIITGL